MDASAAAATVAYCRSFATTPICTQSKKTSMYTEWNKTVTHIFLHDDFVHTMLTHSLARSPLCLFYSSFAISNTNPHSVCIFHSISLCVRFFMCFSYVNVLFSRWILFFFCARTHDTYLYTISCRMDRCVCTQYLHRYHSNKYRPAGADAKARQKKKQMQIFKE